MIEVIYIKEPQLYFSQNGASIDPKIGLLKYGPCGVTSKEKSEPIKIRVGVIATKESVMLLEEWLDRLRDGIKGTETNGPKQREIDFPGLGLDKPLRFDIELDKNAIEYIEEKELDALEPLERKERVAKAFEIYDAKFKSLEAGTDPHPKLVLLPLSEKLIELCKDPKLKTDHIKYDYRTFDKAKKYDDDFPGFDLHNVIKALGIRYGGLVTQVIKPRTLKFNEGTQSPATVAWNFAVGTYYKATGTPWKLAELDSTTCYVGLSFYQEITPEGRNMRAAMAQVYLKTGESQVIRGKKSFQWDKEQSRHPNLTENLAEDIIKDIIDLYKSHNNKAIPKRVVIHKTSPFNDEEIKGFDSGLKDVELVDYIHIIRHNGVRAFPRGDYPALRGTMLLKDDEYILYTSGFVPALNTYPGASVPEPILIRPAKRKSTTKQIGEDILALTKLDWNNSDFNTRLPVTISVSNKVGEVLSETRLLGVENPPSNYRHYM